MEKKFFIKKVMLRKLQFLNKNRGYGNIGKRAKFKGFLKKVSPILKRNDFTEEFSNRTKEMGKMIR